MSKYEVIIYWSKDDQAFIAEVPELPVHFRRTFLILSLPQVGHLVMVTMDFGLAKTGFLGKTKDLRPHS